MTQPYSTARLIASRQPGFSLPRELYCGEQALQDDLQQIWYREWVFAIPSCEIARTGSFSTLQLGEYPVIIVRGADGRVRAFHNVCRHRGQRLCPKTSGSSPKLVCPIINGPMIWTASFCMPVTWEKGLIRPDMG